MSCHDVDVTDRDNVIAGIPTYEKVGLYSSVEVVQSSSTLSSTELMTKVPIKKETS